MKVKIKMFLAFLIFYIVAVFAFDALSSYTIEKNGTCPSGWYTSGNYCIPGKNAPYAVHKTGTCPSGWSTSGKYCVKKGK